MAKTCIIMRGLPGSGKSTEAKKLQQTYEDVGASCVICSNDNYADYYDAKGVYNWTPAKAKCAKRYCQDKFEGALGNWDIIIIDNTNLSSKVYNFYKEKAEAAGYEVAFVVFEPSATVEYIRECARRNTHGVNEAMLCQMLKAWESGEAT